MTSFIEHIRRSEPGRAGADDGYFFIRSDLRYQRFYITLFKSVFYERKLVFLHRNRQVVKTAGAGGFTEGRADASRKLGEIICFKQSGKGVLKIAVVYLVIPLRYEIVERTSRDHPVERHSRLTEGDAAVHTSCSMKPSFLSGKLLVEFIEIFYSFLWSCRRIKFSFIF